MAEVGPFSATDVRRFKESEEDTYACDAAFLPFLPWTFQRCPRCRVPQSTPRSRSPLCIPMLVAVGKLRLSARMSSPPLSRKGLRAVAVDAAPITIGGQQRPGGRSRDCLSHPG
ncbi:hypothetical protein Pan44_05900 [Caulifigura coniformis]|uniref:Uncharacterized protein n=1 Tax=Caulifigura coniformis TaxID=2527983 RepID=A0A517S8Y0_9PLAN|nr:hypothetical protein Pan44_05900 [Caulifigura coniformis]